MERYYGSDGCNNRTEYVRLHEGPCENGLGSEVVLTGPGIKVARWTLRILELWSIQLDSGYEVDNIGPMSAGELRFTVEARPIHGGLSLPFAISRCWRYKSFGVCFH